MAHGKLDETSTALATIERSLPAPLHSSVQLFEESEIRKLALLLEESQSIMSAGVGYTVISSLEQETAAAELIARAYKVEKEAEELRKARVKPLNDEVKAVNEFVKHAFGTLLSLFGKDGEVAKSLVAWRRVEEDRKRREAEELARKQLEIAQKQAQAEESGDASAALQASIEQAHIEVQIDVESRRSKGVVTPSGRVAYRKKWVVEIVDVELVPKQYLRSEVVMEALRMVLQRQVTAGMREIPGCNVYETDDVRRGV